MSDLSNLSEDYPCVGICQIDPESGYCLGCGRPPLPPPESRPESSDIAAATPKTGFFPVSGAEL